MTPTTHQPDSLVSVSTKGILIHLQRCPGLREHSDNIRHSSEGSRHVALEAKELRAQTPCLFLPRHPSKSSATEHPPNGTHFGGRGQGRWGLADRKPLLGLRQLVMEGGGWSMEERSL